jgi:hypothetical protein
MADTFKNAYQDTAELSEAIFKAALEDDLNTSHLVEQYAKLHPKSAYTRLLQDLHRIAYDLENIYEYIKKSDFTSFASDEAESKFVNEIKQRFRKLGLIPPSAFQNTLLSEMLGMLSKAMKNIARAVLQFIADHTGDLMHELRLDTGNTVVVQVEFSWKPGSITIGVERSA